LTLSKCPLRRHPDWDPARSGYHLHPTAFSSPLALTTDAHIAPGRLSLEALGDAARHFSDNGKKPDGGDLYAPADAFSPDELAAAERAGGEVFNGYRFPYQRSVAINSDLPCDAVAGEVEDDRWCGYPSPGIGYAVLLYVAKDVCAASIARAPEESDRIKQKASASCMPYQLAP